MFSPRENALAAAAGSVARAPSDVTDVRNATKRYRRGGRPPLPANRRRSRTITVSVHSQEWSTIVGRASEAGLCVSVYVRKAALGARMSAKVNASVIRQLGRIGANMNQLARVANRTGQLPEERYLREVVEELLAMRHRL